LTQLRAIKQMTTNCKHQQLLQPSSSTCSQHEALLNLNTSYTHPKQLPHAMPCYQPNHLKMLSYPQEVPNTSFPVDRQIA
jgi:hypothetical protein